MQIHAYTYIYKHIHTYMNIYVQVLTYTYIYVHIRTYTSMNLKSAGSAGSAGGSAAGGSASGSASGSAGSDAGAAGSSWFVRVRPGYTVHSESDPVIRYIFFFVRRISGSTSSLWRTKLGVPVQNVRSLQIPQSSRKPNINFQHSMEPPRPSTSD